MATLNWIGKDAVVSHDKDVPFKLLRKVKSASVGEHSQNLIIHGDNLEALKALMPYYVGKIRCIYIDPPYNTGNEGWVYNDKVNSPKIRQWLGKVVGRESEDLTRHDKWLCMMYPRLKLLRDLLSNDGVIFVSIDDKECANLKYLMDEIFGADNFIAQIVWEKMYTTKNDSKMMSDCHEYVFVYAKSILQKPLGLLPRSEEADARYMNPDNDPRGPWKAIPLYAKEERKNGRYPITSPKTGKIWSLPPNKHWIYAQSDMEKLVSDNRVWFGKSGDSTPNLKRFLSDVQQGLKPKTLWKHGEVGSNDSAKKDLKELFGENQPFDYPKPVTLIKRMLQLSTSSNDLVLDSFAGSGTAAHAVLDLNKEDGGARKFIMVEMEDKVAKDITAERVKRAIKKYGYKDGFEYCELDKPLFDENRQIDESCDFKQLATYIYFTETQTNIDSKKISGHYIGESADTDYYLLYKGRDKNDLDKQTLESLKDTGKRRVVYADRCLLDEDELLRYNVTFKQIPYEVKTY
jgi:adenine-specific DNA-methyltransferase